MYNRFISAAWTVRLLLILFCAFFLPVTAAAQEMELPPTGLLQLIVRTGEEEGSIPLANVIFDVYRTNLTAMPESTEPTHQELARCKTRDNLAATVMTDSDGTAALLLPRGIYLLSQQPNPALQDGTASFYIMLRENRQTLSLERIPESPPSLTMDIGTLQQKSGSFDMEETHNWIIRCSVPKGIVNAKEFLITDIFDPGIRYLGGSITVSLWKASGDQVTLTPERHYTLSQRRIQSPKGPVDAVTIALLPEGMTFLAAQLDGENNGELRIILPAAIDRSAPLGGAISNDAHLAYTNAAGITYCEDSDIPEVHTGGISILRTDETGKPLPGAEFMVAREATQEELERESLPKETLHVGSETLAVVYTAFYTEDKRAEKTYTAVTGADGTAAIHGLSYGTYYLVESKTVNGGTGIRPIPVQIGEYSHLTKADGKYDPSGQLIDHTVKISGSGYRFPNTGGSGTAQIKATGILLIFAASMLLFNNRKKRV